MHDPYKLILSIAQLLSIKTERLALRIHLSRLIYLAFEEFWDRLHLSFQGFLILLIIKPLKTNVCHHKAMARFVLISLESTDIHVI